MDAQGLAGAGDQGLDEVVGRRYWRREHDDVLVVRLREAVLKLVDQQHVVDLQRRLHRARRNVERPDNERDQQQRDQPGDDERIEIFAQDDQRRRPRFASIGRGPGGRCRDRTQADGDPDDDEDSDEAGEFDGRHERAPRLTGDLFLLDTGSLADLVGEIVQATASDDTTPRNLDALEPRAVEEKRLLDADAVRDAPYRDRLVRGAAAASGHDPFEHLNALLAALDDAGKHLDGVSRPEIRNGRAFLFLFYQVDDVH